MKSNDEEITWRVIPNTVKSRMKHCSFIHKLKPARKLRRVSKTMNAKMKKHNVVNSYSQYVDMKTMVLRDLSDNTDTEDSANSTDDDFPSIYESETSLINFIRRKSRYKDSSVEDSDNTDDTDKPDNTNLNDQEKSKSKSQENTDIGWRKIKRKRTNSSNSKKNTKDINCVEVDRHNVKSNDKLSSNEKNLLSLENSIPIKKRTVKLSTKVTSLNEVTSNASAVKVNEENSQLENSNAVDKSSSNDEKILTQENNISIKKKTTELPAKVKSSTVASSSTAIKIEEPDPRLENHEETEANINHYNSGTNSNIVEKRNDEALEIQTSASCNKNQPKDSGIEEDAEEECLLQSKKHYKKCRSEVQQKKHNITECKVDTTDPDLKSESSNVPTTDSEDYKKCESTVQQKRHNIKKCMVDRTDPDFKSETSNVPTTDSDDRILCGDKDIITSEAKTEEVQKHKLQPKVIHTEIVDKNYKIVLDSPLITRNLEPRELNAINSCDEQICETEDQECDTDDYISNSARKRLQQLKRLNLTTCSDTSCSENDEVYSNIENMRSKLFNRTLESSESSASETDSIIIKRKLSRVKRNERLSQSDNISQQSDDFSNNENKQKLKRYVDRSPLLSLKKRKKEKSNLSHTYNSSELMHNSDQEEVVKVSEANLGNQAAEQIVNEASVLHRPHTLQEFVENENLKLQASIPSFRFKDIEEDEIFVLDIPAIVLEKQLLGKRMVLTENKLKLGKQKYHVEHKDVGNVSCIVATGKSRKPYKTVNIKPLKRIVAGERIR